MPVPPFQDHLLPALKCLADGQSWNSRKLSDHLMEHFQLSAADRVELLPSGVRTRCLDRAIWSLTYLRWAGLIERVERGRYQITQAGRDLLATAPTDITIALLRSYPVFVKHSRKGLPGSDVLNGEGAIGAQSDDAETPTSRLDAALQEIQSALAVDLLERIAKLSPVAFERLVLQVLSGMGYASDAGAVHHTGQTGDEGIDGIVSQDHLGLDRVYVQAKNWENPVSGPEMNKFIGALDQKRGMKGVYFTRSTFTQQASQFATSGTKQIVMIDGQKLANLMIRFGVGVTTIQEVKVCRVDQDFFDEL
jgi:restriction system protein